MKTKILITKNPIDLEFKNFNLLDTCSIYNYSNKKNTRYYFYIKKSEELQILNMDKNYFPIAINYLSKTCFNDFLLKEFTLIHNFNNVDTVSNIFVNIKNEIKLLIYKDVENFNNEEFIKTVINKIKKKYAFIFSDEAEFFARKCFITGKLMNSGYVVYDDTYIYDEKSLIKYLHENMDLNDDVSNMSKKEYLDYHYDQGNYYYTEWEPEEDLLYIKYNNRVYELEEEIII